MFPGRAGAKINDDCLTCHSSSMVLTQPNSSGTFWRHEADKMREPHKAPIEAAIVAYLSEHEGGAAGSGPEPADHLDRAGGASSPTPRR